MSQIIVKRNIKLWHEFDKYIAHHPALYNRIPPKSNLIITAEGDEALTEYNRSIAKNSRSRHKFLEARKAGNRWTIRPLVEVE